MFVSLRTIPRRLAVPLRAVSLLAIMMMATTATPAKAEVCADAEGQTAANRAMLTGVVVDSAGGALPGVALTLINLAQGTQRKTITTHDGLFAFAMLAPGRYTLRADHVDLVPAEIRDLDLDDGIRTTIIITLRIADVRETVAVRGQIASSVSATASVGTIIGRQTIERVPANGRSVQSLIALMPGVVNASGTGDATGDFSVNGQRPSANYFMVDGVGANIANAVNAPSRASQASGGALPGVTTLGTTASLTPFEALEEVRLQTSSYAAEYGRQPGAQVSLITRAGDSTWRGSLFTQVRHEALNANDWFANRAGQRRLPMRQQQFGGMLGGPLAWPSARDDHRTFFLIAHEHLRLQSPQFLVTSVPTLALRKQAHSGVRPLLDAFPLPNSSSPNDTMAAGTLVGDDDARYGVDTTSVRLDHRVSPALSLFGRLNVAPSSAEAWTPTNLATRRHQRLAANMLTLGATHHWRRTSTDLRINMSANSGDVQEWQTDHLGAIPIPRAQLMPAGLDGLMSSAVVSFPVLTRSDPTPSLSVMSASTAQRQLNIVGTATVDLDRHQLKFGLDVRQLQTRLRQRPYDLSAAFLDVSTVSAGQTTSASLSTQALELWPRFANLSMFAQDTWVVSPRLTVDAGLRWELNPPPGEAHGRLPYTSLNPTDDAVEIAPSGTPLWRTGYHNVAPRFGAAWLLRQTAGRETMVRGGGGLFYDLGNTQAIRGYEGYGYRTSRSLVLMFPIDPSGVAAVAATTHPTDGPLFAFDPDLTLPYTGQWNLSIEQAVGATRSLTASYVGAVGRRQLAQLYRNPDAAGLRYLSVPSIYLTTNDGTSAYHALQWQFEQRLASGFRASVAHTWSHAIDRTSVESRAETATTMARADADFDVRHVFTTAVSYDLPTATRRPLGRALLRDWSIDGRVVVQSGRPLNVIVTNAFDWQGMEQTLWAGRVEGAPLYLDAADAPGGYRINRDAFPLSARGFDPRRNLVRGPGAWQIDLALRRVFALAGPARLTIQANAFNVLNHPNFGNIDPHLSSATFGEPRSMLGRTLGGLNSAYQMGGPRVIELSLRFSL
jgi:hypothetical protein